MTDETMIASGEDGARQDTGVDDQLQAFGFSMGRKRDEWVRDRAARGLDKRFQEDLDSYNCVDNVNKASSQMMNSVAQGFPITTNHAQPHRSTVFIGLTRMKSNAAEARLADILLPTDDRNWGIQPTPVPELSELSQDERLAIDPATGQNPQGPQGPLRIKDVASQKMTMAHQAAEAMQREIDDQLNECDYNGELRKVIHDAVLFGTGCVMGPVVLNQTRKAWTPITGPDGQTVQVMEMVSELKPASFHWDIRNVWPDPACGEDIHAGSGIFLRRKMTKKLIRDLAKQPGYLKEQLRKVLEEGPKQSATMEELRDEEEREHDKNTFELWEYWGEVDQEDLKAAGVEIPEGEDELRSISACVVMVNSTVVKAYLNPLEGGELPIDFFVWEKVTGSPWGYGLPHLMKSQQKVMNAAWRQMMDNSGVTARGQVILKPNLITPADKQWTLTAGKIWFATDEVEDVRTAFAVQEFASHQPEMAGIVEMAQQLADAETGIPQLMQGDPTPGGQTMGEAVIRANSSNVVLRRIVKQFDDMVTRPHIRRYYDYNMLYNENEEVKGDFRVDARGSSTLITRDIQNQAFMNLLAAGANPVYGIYLDTQKLFEKSLQAQHIDPAEVFKPQEVINQIKKAQESMPAQPDPRIAAAQINAQAALQRAQFQAQAGAQQAQAQNAADMQELQLRGQTVQYEQQARMAELQVQREIEMLKLSAAQNISLQEIKAELASTAMKEQTRKEIFNAAAAFHAQTGEAVS